VTDSADDGSSSPATARPGRNFEYMTQPHMLSGHIRPDLRKEPSRKRYTLTLRVQIEEGNFKTEWKIFYIMLPIVVAARGPSTSRCRRGAQPSVPHKQGWNPRLPRSAQMRVRYFPAGGTSWDPANRALAWGSRPPAPHGWRSVAEPGGTSCAVVLACDRDV